MPIFIEDNYMNQIKACLAFPDVDNLLLSDEQIKDICIAPALREYFSKFPIKHEYQEPVGYNEEKTVSFPDSYVFGVLTCCVSDIGNNVIGNGGDFWSIVAYNSFGLGNINISKGGDGMYGITGYNPNNAMEMNELYRDKWKSYQNKYVTLKFHPDYVKKEIKVYSTANGMLNITWAKHSENFQDVHFQFINDVVDLSKARLLDHLADTSGILSDTNLEITINAEALKDKASALRDKVIEKWNAIPDMIYLHVV